MVLFLVQFGYIKEDILAVCNDICIHFHFSISNSCLAVIENKETTVYEGKLGFYVKKLAKKLIVP